MRQIVSEIVHRDLIGQPSPFLRIPGIVGPLPGIAQVHVMTDRDDDPAFVVVDRAPVWRPPGLAFFVGNSPPRALPAMCGGGLSTARAASGATFQCVDYTAIRGCSVGSPRLIEDEPGGTGD